MDRASVSWIDFYGNEITTQLTASSTAAAVIAAMSGMSNASITNWHEGTISSPALGSPGNAAYASVGDMMAMSVVDGIGTSNRIFCPAPVQGMFTADENTADTLTDPFAAMSAATAGVLMNLQLGTPIVFGIAGWLFRRSLNIRESYICAPSSLSGHPALRRAVVWADTFGLRTITYYYGVNPMEAFLTTFATGSNAIPLQSWEGPLTIASPGPFGDVYAGVKDLARFTFNDDKGNRANVMLPAPKLALFKADGKTIDPAYYLVAPFIADVLGNLVAPQSGLPLTRFIGGILVRSKEQGQQ